MYQLFAVIISFSIIPILIKRKVKLSYTLLITAGVLGILSNLGGRSVFDSVLAVFINPASRSTVLTVLMVSILGGLMGHYNILGKVVDTLGKIIRNKRNILMIIPAFVGLLVIPGGALLSAPFINDIGKDLNIAPAKKAAINLIFRHIAMFIMPYSTGILIILSSFPDINIAKTIALNLIFVSLLIFLGYFLFIRDIQTEIRSKRKEPVKNIIRLMVLTSPIYIPVLITLTTGLKFYITLLLSVVIVYFLGNKKNFIENFLKSINWHTVGTVVAILIVKEIILKMDNLLVIFTSMFKSGGNILYISLIFFITSIFFGFITGNLSAALAVTLPILAQLNVSTNELYTYIYLAYVSAFMGYFFSPLHLCQAFTVEVMGVTTGELYKEYRKYIALMLLILIGTFSIFRMVFV